LQRRATLVRPAVLAPLSSGARTLAHASFVYAAELRSGFGHLPCTGFVAPMRRTIGP
jgi:hypothetical protein